MSHGDSVSELPEGFKALGGTSDCPVAAMGHSEKLIFGLSSTRR